MKTVLMFLQFSLISANFAMAELSNGDCLSKGALFGDELNSLATAFERVKPQDRLISTVRRLNTLTCETTGMCFKSGYNMATGRFESSYGLHPNCEGEKTQEVIEKTYMRPDKSIYVNETYGTWSSCKI